MIMQSAGPNLGAENWDVLQENWIPVDFDRDTVVFGREEIREGIQDILGLRCSSLDDQSVQQQQSVSQRTVMLRIADGPLALAAPDSRWFCVIDTRDGEIFDDNTDTESIESFGRDADTVIANAGSSLSVAADSFTGIGALARITENLVGCSATAGVGRGASCCRSTLTGVHVWIYFTFKN